MGCASGFRMSPHSGPAQWRQVKSLLWGRYCYLSPYLPLSSVFLLIYSKSAAPLVDILTCIERWNNTDRKYCQTAPWGIIGRVEIACMLMLRIILSYFSSLRHINLAITVEDVHLANPLYDIYTYSRAAYTYSIHTIVAEEHISPKMSGKYKLKELWEYTLIYSHRINLCGN